MTQIIETRFRVRRWSAAEWITRNEVLLDSEYGRETDTNRVKLGDGITAWNDLPYVGAGEIELSTAPTDAQVLAWDATSGRWVPTNQSGGGAGGDDTLTWLGL